MSKSCGLEPIVNNAVASLQQVDNKTVAARYQCLPGFRVSGMQRILCQAPEYKWQEPPSCKPKQDEVIVNVRVVGIPTWWYFLVSVVLVLIILTLLAAVIWYCRKNNPWATCWGCCRWRELNYPALNSVRVGEPVVRNSLTLQSKRRAWGSNDIPRRDSCRSLSSRRDSQHRGEEKRWNPHMRVVTPTMPLGTIA